MIRLSVHSQMWTFRLNTSGLRPGEKLFEEKLTAEEGLKKTQNDLIHIGCPIPFDIDVILGQLEELMDCGYKKKENVRDILQRVVSHIIQAK